MSTANLVLGEPIARLVAGGVAVLIVEREAARLTAVAEQGPGGPPGPQGPPMELLAHPVGPLSSAASIAPPAAAAVLLATGFDQAGDSATAQLVPAADGDAGPGVFTYLGAHRYKLSNPVEFASFFGVLPDGRDCAAGFEDMFAFDGPADRFLAGGDYRISRTVLAPMRQSLDWQLAKKARIYCTYDAPVNGDLFRFLADSATYSAGAIPDISVRGGTFDQREQLNSTSTPYAEFYPPRRLGTAATGEALSFRGALTVGGTPVDAFGHVAMRTRIIACSRGQSFPSSGGDSGVYGNGFRRFDLEPGTYGRGSRDVFAYISRDGTGQAGDNVSVLGIHLEDCVFGVAVKRSIRKFIIAYSLFDRVAIPVLLTHIIGDGVRSGLVNANVARQCWKFFRGDFASGFEVSATQLESLGFLFADGSKPEFVFGEPIAYETRGCSNALIDLGTITGTSAGYTRAKAVVAGNFNAAGYGVTETTGLTVKGGRLSGVDAAGGEEDASDGNTWHNPDCAADVRLPTYALSGPSSRLIGTVAVPLSYVVDASGALPASVLNGPVVQIGGGAEDIVVALPSTGTGASAARDGDVVTLRRYASGGGKAIVMKSSGSAVTVCWLPAVADTIKFRWNNATSSWEVLSKSIARLRQWFLEDDDWHKAPLASRVRVKGKGVGGSGGSGRRGAPGTVRTGGAGGSGGAFGEGEFPASLLPDTVPVRVDPPGAGGAPVTTDNTNGNPGADGGLVRFGAPGDPWFVNCAPGKGGAGGRTTAAAGGAAPTYHRPSGDGGSSSSTGREGGAGGRGISPGGGAGGGIGADNAVSAGGAGWDIDNSVVTGGAPGSNGNSPADATTTGDLMSAGSGSGGGSRLGGPGGNGAKGGEFGGGSGGGSASENGYDSGGGAEGTPGAILVETDF